MKPLKGNQQLRSVSLSHSVALQALNPKPSPRRRRGLDASNDRGLKERSAEVFFLDILSHRMSAAAISTIDLRSINNLKELAHRHFKYGWADATAFISFF